MRQSAVHAFRRHWVPVLASAGVHRPRAAYRGRGRAARAVLDVDVTAAHGQICGKPARHAVAWPSPGRLSKLKRRDAETALEMLGQRALIAEPGCQSTLRHRAAALQVAAGGLQSDVYQVRVRRQADPSLEKTYELKAREIAEACELFKPDVFVVPVVHHVRWPGRQALGRAERAQDGPVATVSLEQRAKSFNDGLVGAEEITWCFEDVVEVPELGDQIGILEHALRETRSLQGASSTSRRRAMSSMVDGTA